MIGIEERDPVRVHLRIVHVRRVDRGRFRPARLQIQRGQRAVGRDVQKRASVHERARERVRRIVVDREGRAFAGHEIDGEELVARLAGPLDPERGVFIQNGLRKPRMHGLEFARFLCAAVVRHHAPAAVRRGIEIDDPAVVHGGETDALVLHRQREQRVPVRFRIVQQQPHERRRAVGRIVADRRGQRRFPEAHVRRVLVLGDHDLGLHRQKIRVVQRVIRIRIGRRLLGGKRRFGRGGRGRGALARIGVVCKVSEKRHAELPDRESERGKKPQPEQDLEVGQRAEPRQAFSEFSGGTVPFFVLHAVILPRDPVSGQSFRENRRAVILALCNRSGCVILNYERVCGLRRTRKGTNPWQDAHCTANTVPRRFRPSSGRSILRPF